MSTDIEDEIKDDPQENQENTLNKYTEEELEDMKEKFRLFDDDGGGGLTAKELERRKKYIFFLVNLNYHSLVLMHFYNAYLHILM